jgi:ABC-type transport system involved in cytochrome bd biosynthesis fused ATPase/permease subunit
LSNRILPWTLKVTYATLPAMIAALVFDSPMDIGIVVLILLFLLITVPILIYRHGKKVGDSLGYIRGFKEGQESLKK